MNKPPREASAKITATMEFSSSGRLKSILLSAETAGDQAILERALTRYVKSDDIYSRLLQEDPLGINPLLLVAALLEEMEP